jgi:hypothetical protein
MALRFTVRRVIGWGSCLFILCNPAHPRAEIQWDPAWHVTLNGQRISVETFSSTVPVDRVVRNLVANNGVYERYLVADGRMLLTGVRQGKHWVAEVVGAAEGSAGYVSALYFDPALHVDAKAPSFTMVSGGHGDLKAYHGQYVFDQPSATLGVAYRSAEPGYIVSNRLPTGSPVEVTLVEEKSSAAHLRFLEP